MMSPPSSSPAPAGRSRPARWVVAIGDGAAAVLHGISRALGNLGGMARLLGETLRWAALGMFSPRIRLGRAALAAQMVRVGVRSVGIVALVQAFIGCILALQLAPILESYGQVEKVADVVAVAIVRELGPLITAIVLSGFAGASIAAELGAMVEAEEIKALRAHALNPILFLVVPRFLATVIMIVGLAVIADVVGVTGGFLTAWGVLDMTPQTYLQATQAAVAAKDFLTGLTKAAVFGVLITIIAAHEGLTVTGGAEGVGRATTVTVVKSIVAIIGMDAVFTAGFYAFEL